MRDWKAKVFSKRNGLIVFAAVLIMLFYSYFYADFYETGCEGVGFWDILFSGKIRQFYTQIFLIGDMQYVPLYDFPMYIIFAIWNLPLWIVQKVTAIDIYHSSLCLMWMKSLMLFWSLLFVKTFKMLLAELHIESSDQKLGIWLFFSSGFYMSGLVVLSQYDIISLTLIMLGITYYMRGDMRKFILIFALAAPLKYFALLVFVPLLLLKEKKVWRIILDCICVMIPCVFFWKMFPYGRPELVAGAEFSPSSSGSNVAKPVYMDLFDRGSVGFGILFLFIFAEVIFLLFCYMYKEEKVWTNGRLVAYTGFMAFFIQFTFAYSHPYWQILMVPYTTVLIMLNKRYRYINLLLETIYTGSFIFAQMFYFTWCFKSEIVNFSFWKYLFTPGSGEGLTVVGFFEQFVSDSRLQEYAVGVGLSIYAAAILLFAVLNCPFIKKELPVTGADMKIPGWLLTLRAVMALCVGAVPLLLYFIKWS